MEKKKKGNDENKKQTTKKKQMVLHLNRLLLNLALCGTGVLMCCSAPCWWLITASFLSKCQNWPDASRGMQKTYSVWEATWRSWPGFVNLDKSKTSSCMHIILRSHLLLSYQGKTQLGLKHYILLCIFFTDVHQFCLYSRCTLHPHVLLNLHCGTGK